jgi:UDP-glucose 4-epimerase
VFDLGGVLIDWDPRHLYRRRFAGDEVAMEHFLATICTHEWNRGQDAGRTDPKTSGDFRRLAGDDRAVRLGETRTGDDTAEIASGRDRDGPTRWKMEFRSRAAACWKM